MNTAQFKERLEQEEGKLTSELSSFAVNDKDNPGDWDSVREVDPGATGSSEDVADQLEDLNERKATEGPLEKQLAKVKLALQKIKEGKFGKCEIGDEEIEADRLSANPSARTCKSHMEEEEKLPI